MSELTTRLLICIVAVLFISVSLILTKPVSDGGRLTRKLCIANAVGWLFILPFSSRGHPPPVFFPAALFWLINLVLLPAAVAALWASRKEREEGIPFVTVASTYIVMNLLVLFVVPFVWVLWEASS